MADRFGRREFLKRASGIIAAVAAPLFIPSDRLDFGVPKQRIVLPEQHEGFRYLWARQDTFLRRYPTQPEVTYGGGVLIGEQRLLSIPERLSVMADGTPMTMRFQDSADGQTWREMNVVVENGLYHLRNTQAYVRPVITVNGGPA